MRSAALIILEPPYSNVRRLHDIPPELGAIALLDAVPNRYSTNEVKAQMDLTPWCPLCIIAEEVSGMRSARRLPRTCLVFGTNNDDGGAGILRAVASRPRPTPSDMVEWIGRRTRLPTIGRLLSDLFTRPTLRRNEASLLPYATREQLRLLGDWNAAEWQRAAVLADLAADRTLLTRTIASDEPGAVEHRRAMHDLLGMTERDFHSRYGWEWVLEASLRRSGFFARRSNGVRPLHPARAVVPPLVAAGGMFGENFEPRRASA
ncbi:MAG: hypothetical protein ABIT38_09395 [Gemmatimonadaceae bacterium]